MGLLKFEMLLPAFALVLARMSGMMLAVPMMASTQVPRLVKVFLAATLSLMVFPVVAPRLPQSLSLTEAAAGMVGEFVIGEVLGLAAGMVFFAAQIAGKIVSHQSGFALGEVFNPLFDEEFTVLDQVWFFAAFMFFLALRGHVAVVTLVLQSFERVPPMALGADAELGEFAVNMARAMFDVALRLSGPAVLALLLASLVMGFLTKTMPQLNVLSVGFTLKIIIALGVMGVTIASSEGVMTRAMSDGLDSVGRLFEHLSERVNHG
jgi:flagellar biosynthetic protein FliR